jgi:hypothetical protein
MACSLVSTLLLGSLLLLANPVAERGVEGGAVTTPACIAACMMGPCATATGICKLKLS